MAEFTEVCKQAFRKAEAESGAKPHYAFLFVSATGTNVVAHTGELAVPPEKLEADIMQWAAEHPEPRYPTWDEWFKITFPDSEYTHCPCPNVFYRICNPTAYHGEVECYQCRNSPIPAYIAEKLGIKPIGGNEQ